MRHRGRGILSQAPQVRTSVLVPFVRDEAGRWCILFTQRAWTLRRQPGEISFPGGHEEPNDVNDAATAIRETREELGLAENDMSYMGPLDVLVAWSGLLVFPHAGVIQDIASLNPNSDEVDNVFYVPVEELLTTQPGVYEVPLQPVPPPDFPYDKIPGGRNYAWRETRVTHFFYELQGRIVWGLTARILTHVLDVIRSMQ